MKKTLIILWLALWVAPMCFAVGETTLKGSQLKASSVAMAAFIKEQDHVDLKNFEVIISDMGESFEVVFVPNTDPEQPGLKGGRNKYGREIHYRVSKEKYEIIGKSYAR